VDKLFQQQKVQEEQYVFPYHYLGMASEQHRLLYNVDYEHFLRIVLTLAAPFLQTDTNVLDAGCGDGRLCYELAIHHGVKATGIDFSKAALRFARAFNPQLKFIHANLMHLTFKEKFDVVFLLEVIEHFPPQEVDDALSEIHSVMRPGGKLILSAPSANIPITPKHYQHFMPQMLENILHGKFSVESCFGFLHSRKSRWLSLCRRIGLSCWPWQHRIPLLRKIVTASDHYISKIEDCDVDVASDLILIASRT